jgi:hypothetical protein
VGVGNMSKDFARVSESRKFGDARKCNCPKRDCVCCNIFGTDIGDFVGRFSNQYNAIITAASSTTILAERITYAQTFYYSVIDLLSMSFDDYCGSPSCCEGFANNLKGSFFGIAVNALVLIFNIQIEIGAPTDTQPNTVYGIIYNSIQALNKIVKDANSISTCCDDAKKCSKK